MLQIVMQTEFIIILPSTYSTSMSTIQMLYLSEHSELTEEVTKGGHCSAFILTELSFKMGMKELFSSFV